MACTISSHAKEAKNASMCILNRLKWNLMMTMTNFFFFLSFCKYLYAIDITHLINYLRFYVADNFLGILVNNRLIFSHIGEFLELPKGNNYTPTWILLYTSKRYIICRNKNYQMKPG